jgi:AcrR family transcriptional regulator
LIVRVQKRWEARVSATAAGLLAEWAGASVSGRSGTKVRNRISGGVRAGQASALMAGSSLRRPPIAVRPDRRPERTRQALVRALVDLILERGYEQLSVDDVVERSNIGRSTLYVHFGGLEGILKESLTVPSTALADIVERQLTPQQLVPQLDHFKEQRRRNRAFFVPPIRGIWVRRLAEMIEPRLAARPGARPAAALPPGLVAHQLAESQIALVANWLAISPATPSETIAAALIATTRATLAGLTSPTDADPALHA